jgi:hypothetical protein
MRIRIGRNRLCHFNEPFLPKLEGLAGIAPPMDGATQTC